MLRSVSFPTILVVQILAILSAFVVLAVYPPATGRMLLYPVTKHAMSGMIALATHQQARLVGNGPLPGSFIVEANRAALVMAMARHGVLTVAAPQGGCG